MSNFLGAAGFDSSLTVFGTLMCVLLQAECALYLQGA